MTTSHSDPPAPSARGFRTAETELLTQDVLILDGTRNRKDGFATDHVTRQYQDSVGKIGNSLVAATTLWTDEQHNPLAAYDAPHSAESTRKWPARSGALHTKP